MKGTQVINITAIPNWELSGFVEYIPSGHKQGDMILVVPKGAFAVRLGNEASIKQKISVKKGSYYSITFSAARTCAQDERLNVSVAPHHAVMPIQTVYSSSGWDLYSWAFKAQSDYADIVIHNPGVEEDPACGPLIDGVAMRALFPPRPTNSECSFLILNLGSRLNKNILNGANTEISKTCWVYFCFAENILKNGGFEEGPWVLPNISSGVLIPPNSIDDHSPLPGWMVESLKAVKYIDSDHFSVPQGRRAVELVAGKESAVAQVVRTIPGKTYVLSFSVGDASNACAGSMIVEAFAGKDTIKVPYESKGKGGFKRSSLRFVAVSSRTRVMFYSTFYAMRNDDFSSLCGPVIDDVKLLSARRP